MLKVDIPQVALSSEAIFGIVVVFCDFNRKVFERVSYLIDIMWCEMAEEKETRLKKEREERRREEE